VSRLALSLGDRTELAERLNLVGKVIKLQAIVLWSIRLLIVGLLLDCIWLVGARFLPYGLRPSFLLIAPAALAVVGGLAAAVWHLSDQRVARRADRVLGLKERLITAVELQQRRASSPLVSLQLRDAVEQFRRYEPMESFPIRLPARELNALLVLSVVAIGLVLAPNPMEQTVRQREQVAVTIKQEAERINKLADDLSAQEEPEDFADIQDALRAASAAIGDRQLSPEEANAALQRLEQRLLASQDPGTGELEDALASLAGSLASEASTRDLGTSLARGDIRQAAQEMRRLGEEADSMAPADRLKLSRALRQAGNRTSRSNAALGQALLQGGEALDTGQSDQASESLGEAANQLDNSAGRLRAASQRERALAQLQQSRSAITRSQQASQSGSSSGAQRGQGRPAGASTGEGVGESLDDFAGSGEEGEPGSGDRPGGSGAGTGQGSHEESIYDPMLSVGRPEVVPGQEAFDPNEAFENPGLDSPYGNEAQVGYKQVFTEYQEKATQTLQNTYIPAGLKDIVKDYFSALAPNN
jgi:hypothetical protein